MNIYQMPGEALADLTIRIQAGGFHLEPGHSVVLTRANGTQSEPIPVPAYLSMCEILHQYGSQLRAELADLIEGLVSKMQQDAFPPVEALEEADFPPRPVRDNPQA